MSELSETQIDRSASNTARQKDGHANTVIGLTGTMGSGKSTVRQLLASQIPATDCDAINAALLQKGAAGYEALLQAGLLPLNDNLEADKVQMAQRMFFDPAYRKDCEGILHPLIRQSMKEWIAAQSALCVVEVPLLFEAGMQDDFDEIWTVTCSLPTALERLASGRNISKEEALARIEKQMPAEQKCAGSDAVLYNDGTLSDLQSQIQKQLERLDPAGFGANVTNQLQDE